jgi:uncharacterized protein with ParB-like and HNH nuclease domain
MEKELEAGPVTLLQVFKGEREYYSPLFQRRYIWGKSELSRLWTDIDSIIDGTEKTKFLGALVLEVKGSGLAFQPDKYWIIDGQQRLTTLYTMILLLAKEAEKSKDLELANSLYKQYLFNQNGIYTNQPKLIPTIQDYQQFYKIFSGIEDLLPKLPTPYGDENGKLRIAEKYLLKEIKNRCFDGNKFDRERATILSTTLLEKLKFVQIALGSNQEPQQVYDALNNRGVKLEIKDILRNKIFQQVSSKPDIAQAFYDRDWRPFEKELGNSLDDYFFPFALADKPTVTKTSLASDLGERWKNSEPDKIVSELRVFLPTYHALTNDNDSYRETATSSEEINQFLARFYRMEIPSTIYPFVFKLLESYSEEALSEESTIKNLKLIESFLIRRAFAGYEPTGLHAVFKDLWNKTAGSPDVFIETFDKNKTVQFPDDTEFKKYIQTKSLYKRRLSRYIVEEYERSLAGGDPYPEGIKPTIDHIIPQTLTDEWKRTVTNKIEFDKIKDTWGNLVPLSGNANSEKRQKTWKDVRKFFKTETIYKTTKRLAEENEHWDLDSVKRRSNELSIWAVKRWPKNF